MTLTCADCHQPIDPSGPWWEDETCHKAFHARAKCFYAEASNRTCFWKRHGGETAA